MTQQLGTLAAFGEDYNLISSTPIIAKLPVNAATVDQTLSDLHCHTQSCVCALMPAHKLKI